jgi:hypothetical protein
VSAIHPILQDGFAGDLTTVRYLQLLCGFSLEDAARFCFVAPETFRRWRMDRPPNRAAIRDPRRLAAVAGLERLAVRQRCVGVARLGAR